MSEGGKTSEKKPQLALFDFLYFILFFRPCYDNSGLPQLYYNFGFFSLLNFRTCETHSRKSGTIHRSFEQREVD